MRISAVRFSALAFLVLSFVVNHAYADGEHSSSLQVSPASLTIAVGETARLTTTNSVGSLRVKSSAPAVATVSYANSRISVIRNARNLSGAFFTMLRLLRFMLFSS